MNKLLIIWCLVSASLFCFTNASPTSYNNKNVLLYGNKHHTLSNTYRKREEKGGHKDINDQMDKRVVTDSKAFDIATTEAEKPDATNSKVLQALFNLVLGKVDPIAAGAADVISKISHIEYIHWRIEIENVFQNSAINEDTKEFFDVLFSEPRNYRKVVIGIVLALVRQQNHRLLGHSDLNYVVNDTISINGFARDLGHSLLTMGEEFTYNGELPRPLVIEVIVAAVAVSTGEARTPMDIPQQISYLSQ
jgi:hypothetical protein